MDDIERDATVVKELYDLIETYKVPTPPEDLAVYQVWALQSTSADLGSIKILGFWETAHLPLP